MDSKTTSTNKKHASTLAVILLIIILTLGVIMVIEYNDLRVLKVMTEQQLDTLVDLKWNYIWARTLECYNTSKLLSEEVKTEIIQGIEKEYRDNPQQLEKDLKTLNESSKLMKIIGESVQGKYFMNIQNSNNSIWVNTENEVITSQSIDRCVEDRTRQFDQEYPVHFNPTLAELAVSNIVNQTNSYVFYHYNKVDQDKPWYTDIKNLNKMDVKEVEKIFKKYKGDINVLEGFEWISTSYIYETKDLLGKSIINYRGYKQDTYQIMVNSNFNIIDVINSNTTYSNTIKTYDNKMQNIIDAYEQERQTKITLLIVEFLVFIISFLSISKIQHSLFNE